MSNVSLHLKSHRETDGFLTQYSEKTRITGTDGELYSVIVGGKIINNILKCKKIYSIFNCVYIYLIL